MESIFRPAALSQKISAGADPKSVLCVFYKQGMCTKGDKCKFSHDVEMERKSEKKSLYVDSRDLEEGMKYCTCTQRVYDKGMYICVLVRIKAH